MPKNWAIYDIIDANPLANWKAAHANSQAYPVTLPTIDGAEHSGLNGFNKIWNKQE